MHAEFWSENIKGKHLSGELDVNERINNLKGIGCEGEN
jgi:hypothetical protein